MTTLIVYRISDSRYPIFDGTGAMINGGRWNSPGNAVIYASLSFSCALLEILVRVGRGGIPKNQKYVKIEIPNTIKGEKIDSYKSGIEVRKMDILDCRTLGDIWYSKRKSAYLIVPSVVAPEDSNIIINTQHPDFHKIKVSTPLMIEWDERLFR
ncbi:MAG: RES domain-containing protein [Proteobacteria bacterium]|nr:RES domain-containing protein [Pseudomonadota bacterium]